MEELQAIVTDKVTEVKEEKTHSTPSEHINTHNSHRDWEEPSYDSKASEGLNPGEIVVTWKDGNVSTLYPEPAEEGQGQEDVHQHRWGDSFPKLPPRNSVFWGNCILIYMYAFSRRFYPKRLTMHSGYTFFYQYCVFPGNWNPQPFALLTQCSTTEPQEQLVLVLFNRNVFNIYIGSQKGY